MSQAFARAARSKTAELSPGRSRDQKAFASSASILTYGVPVLQKHVAYYALSFGFGAETMSLRRIGNRRAH
jgi:hypothetical protein